ncbi:hypothetical protein [Nonomuraea salmonea]|uniref:hypothetical protein n=1 Tax=Nonomuraea salmonea TaxID=46181 RepID=UPI0031ED4567
MAGRPPHRSADAPHEVIAAARDNAAWCDLMCRAHGRPGMFAGVAWTNPVRTPPFYPDAVTLSPLATATDVLPHIDAGSGASVKDSFATLDLPGFEVLFEAHWIHRPAPRPGGDDLAGGGGRRHTRRLGERLRPHRPVHPGPPRRAGGPRSCTPAPATPSPRARSSPRPARWWASRTCSARARPGRA